MCGRYTYTQIPELDEEHIVFPEGNDIPLSPRYNIAPSNYAPVILQQDPKMIHFLRWGLIPSWADPAKPQGGFINARCETILEKPSFRSSVPAHRCLVLADSFYEWKTTGKAKQPFRIGLDDFKPFYMAGLSSQWINAEGKQIETYTILTTTPNDLMHGIHDRMPVIFQRAEAIRWLDSQEDPVQLIQELCQPFDASEMEAYPVSKAVGNVRNDEESLIEPLA